MTQKFLAFGAFDDPTRRVPARLADALARLGCAQRWSVPGLIVFASEDLPLRVLADGQGVMLGQAFDPSGAPVARRVEGELSAVGAEALVARLWGSYVAFARHDGRLRVLRDPSGGIACYEAEVAGAQILTSVPHLPVDCGLVPADIDWSMVAGSLMRRRTRLPATALRGVREVLPGQLLTFAHGRMTAHEAWDPWRVALERPAGNPAERLEQVLASTLQAWTQCTGRPLIEISGGLDSAIVAAGIAAAAPGASLITFSAAPGDADETVYARAVAEHLGLPLEIAAPRIEDVELTRSLSGDLPRPNARAFTQAMDALSLRHARSIGADAFLSGGGGDDVFCYLRTILPALDRLWAEGWRAMLATAHDVAVTNHSTTWEALTRIARRLLRGPSAGVRPDLRLLARDLAFQESEAARLPPTVPVALGKADHVRGVLTIHNYLDGHARAQFAPIISPLLSQPVVECCLSIPTWLWCKGGRNRAVARQAFERRLPEIVIERRSKGGFDSFCGRLLQANCRLVRAMLLDGRLAGEGLLDRPAVEAALQSPSPPADTVARLLELVDAESWTQSWSSRHRAGR